MSVQDQFLNVIDRDQAESRFRAALKLEPLGEETILLTEALGRVLAVDVVANVDVPSFDRSNFDGFAVRAEDTFGAEEEEPQSLKLLAEVLHTGVVPQCEIRPGTAASIATGGMLPRGADAVVMIEFAEAEGDTLQVRKPVTPASGVSFAGTDIAAGEIVLRRGTPLTSRETGVLAAIGEATLQVYRQPKVAIISTGDEIIAPGENMQPPLIYDSNAQVLADAVRELGCSPLRMGIVRDDIQALSQAFEQSLAEADVVLFSGGTSKGEGDLCYRVVSELADPGILAHGVALKPGKPICLAASKEKPVVILPGFPTSAIFTFHEFVAPVLQMYAGRMAATDKVADTEQTVPARLATQVNSQVGRTEYLLVGLVDGSHGLTAFPMGKGSGSVTTFSQADGFITIARHTEMVAAQSPVQVKLIGRELKPADLVVIGSHCVGLDYLLSRMQDEGYSTKLFAVGSSAGLEAARRGECDLAGIHLYDPNTDQYNRPFLSDEVDLLTGYGRRQGIVFRSDDERLAGKTIEQMMEIAMSDRDVLLVNRNQGSGTRILLDGLLAGQRPPGYAVQARSHSAVAAAVAQGRADWGMAIDTVAKHHQLGFVPYRDEQYDFAVPRSRLSRPAVQAFADLLRDNQVALEAMGFRVNAT